MVIWIWLLLAMLVTTVVQVVLLERRSRQLQWREFTALMRRVDGRCRSAGWILVEASFRPGWRWVGEAFQVVKAWGFNYSTTLVWAKTPRGTGLGGTFGISTEFVLFASRGRVDAPARVSPTTWFNWKRVYARGPQHSAKPEAFYDLVMQASPGPRIELFSRTARLGWDTWGDEALHGKEAMSA